MQSTWACHPPASASSRFLTSTCYHSQVWKFLHLICVEHHLPFEVLGICSRLHDWLSFLFSSQNFLARLLLSMSLQPCVLFCHWLASGSKLAGSLLLYKYYWISWREQATLVSPQNLVLYVQESTYEEFLWEGMSLPLAILSSNTVEFFLTSRITVLWLGAVSYVLPMAIDCRSWCLISLLAVVEYNKGSHYYGLPTLELDL